MPTEAHQPRSTDPKVTEAWSKRRVAEGYDRVVASWRSQRTTAVVVETNILREPVTDTPDEKGGKK